MNSVIEEEVKKLSEVDPDITMELIHFIHNATDLVAGAGSDASIFDKLNEFIDHMKQARTSAFFGEEEERMANEFTPSAIRMCMDILHVSNDDSSSGIRSRRRRQSGSSNVKVKLELIADKLSSLSSRDWLAQFIAKNEDVFV